MYELLTSGPLATYLNPTTSSPYRFQCSNFSGVTYSMTSRWLGVGRRYWPSVKMSTPASLQSLIVWAISSSLSPSPSMMLVLVTRPVGPVALACLRTRRD